MRLSHRPSHRHGQTVKVSRQTSRETHSRTTLYGCACVSVSPRSGSIELAVRESLSQPTTDL